MHTPHAQPLHAGDSSSHAEKEPVMMSSSMTPGMILIQSFHVKWHLSVVSMCGVRGVLERLSQGEPVHIYFGDNDGGF